MSTIAFKPKTGQNWLDEIFPESMPANNEEKSVHTNPDLVHTTVHTTVHTDSELVCTNSDDVHTKQVDSVRTNGLSVQTDVHTNPDLVHTSSNSVHTTVHTKSERIDLRMNGGAKAILSKEAIERGFCDMSDLIRSAIVFALNHEEFRKPANKKSSPQEGAKGENIKN